MTNRVFSDPVVSHIVYFLTLLGSPTGRGGPRTYSLIGFTHGPEARGRTPFDGRLLRCPFQGAPPIPGVSDVTSVFALKSIPPLAPRPFGTNPRTLGRGSDASEGVAPWFGYPAREVPVARMNRPPPPPWRVVSRGVRRAGRGWGSRGLRWVSELRPRKQRVWNLDPCLDLIS